MEQPTYAYMTPKGLALAAAIRAGLVPKVPGGYDFDSFERFWEDFSQRAEVRIIVSLQQPGEQRR